MVKNIIVGIMSNFLFDIMKKYKLKIGIDVVEEQLNNFLKEFEDSEVDSGAFDQFLKLSNTKSDIINYIEYGIYKDSIKEDSITKEQFLNIITNNACKYIKSKRNIELLSINKNSIRKYFNVLMKTIEKLMLQELTKDKKYNMYLIRIKMDEILDRINAIDKYNYENQSEKMDDIKDKYLLEIRKKYSKSHIYGIDELKFSQFYVKPTFIVNSQENELTSADKDISNKNIDIKVVWEEIFEYSNIISVIGGAGFGKTLFLKNLMNEYKNLNLVNANEMIPIYCDLKKFAQRIKNNIGYTISEFLIDSMRYDTSLNEINIDFLNVYLNKGQLLILFDALDEVVYEEREDIHRKIVDFFNTVNKNNRICITSRERGFIPRTSISYKVNKLNDSDIKKYIEKMIRINKFNNSYKEKFLRECQKLINIDFLNSFLLLSLLVNIYSAERRMPKNKIELYRKAVEYITREREQGIGDGYTKKSDVNFERIASILDRDESFEIIANLAKPNNNDVAEEKIIKEFLEIFKYDYACKNDVKNAINEFLKFCSERTELVIKSTSKQYKFYHKSFFEYFYSKYIINNFDLDKILKEIISDDLDNEIILIVLEILKCDNTKKYRQLIEMFIGNLENGKIHIKDSMKLTIYLEEIGYLLRVINLFTKNTYKFDINAYKNIEEGKLNFRRNNMFLIKLNKLNNEEINKVLEEYIAKKCYKEYIECVFEQYIRRNSNYDNVIGNNIKRYNRDCISYMGIYTDKFVNSKELTVDELIKMLKNISVKKKKNREENEKYKGLMIMKFYSKYFNLVKKEVAIEG